MAYYALLDKNGIVVQVITGKDDGDEGIYDWETFYSQETGLVAKKTSDTGIIRKNYAGIGYTYDPVRDAFIPPQPTPDAVLDEATCQWIVPVINAVADSIGADSV